MLLESMVKSRTDYFLFITTTGILGILICLHSLKFEYKYDKLELLRKSVILETSMARENTQRQMEKILNSLPNREVMIDFEREGSLGMSGSKSIDSPYRPRS